MTAIATDSYHLFLDSFKSKLSDAAKLLTMPQLTPLRNQYPSYASPQTKIRLSMLATAMVDALGGPAEFQGRFTFDPVTTMIPNDNFGLEPGVWTDDTSMALCLARSLAHSKEVHDGFDEKDQLRAYLAWFNRGELSAIGRCFDIGGTTNRALSMFDTYQGRPIKEILNIIRRNLSAIVFSGNGSLMRVLPVGLTYWGDESQARVYAGRSSCTTHPSPLCVEACEAWTVAIVKIMQATATGTQYLKLDVIEHFSSYPYSNSKLQLPLNFPKSVTPLRSEASLAEKEEYYWQHHPLLQKVSRTNKGESGKEIPGLPYPMPSVKDVPSTGYVVDSLVAALYCFMGTQTFEEGALMAVNMGSDADTVGAIYAGLAGVWYAEDVPSEKFWSKRVIEWKEKLVKRELVEQVTDELVAFSEKLTKNL
ncbi:hypothetical protein D9756_003255 [Leucocoprinus leucothites]|uniref:ADP-ribosylhydrolase ARH3 n=1 Tax=Leucocoprinus leucothites TaxID=201217 RepID=A0A8H5LJ16_9AGAR|nr:hypothetical protein D9756_003255 [Leucoagaricus leucothites]